MKRKSDEETWMQVAQNVLRGKYNKADKSTIESLKIGLRSIQNKICRQAFIELENLKT